MHFNCFITQLPACQRHNLTYDDMQVLMHTFIGQLQLSDVVVIMTNKQLSVHERRTGTWKLGGC